MKHQGSKYRADVDGLRAVSVILVLINHANESLAPSGFVGVDVFFVISGFVVTSSLLSGHHGAGWQGLREFWRRRILRILPALIVFSLITTTFFASFFALTTNIQFESSIRTGIASLFGLSNLYLSYISTDYFLLDQSINPFLHTWSLGIEEQFYFVFAILFFAVMGVFRADKQTLMLAIATLGIASFCAFHWGMTEQPILTYYGLHSRFWELGIGVLLALWKASRTERQGRQALSEVMGFLGITMILIAAFAIDGGAEGAKYSVTVAVFGAALFISSGFLEKNASAKFLSSKPLVFIGVLSYSIYLYHWPVLIFVKSNLQGTLIEYCMSFVLIFALSYLSYRLVETPFRRLRMPLLNRTLPMFAAVILLSATALQFAGSTQGKFYAGAPINYQDWLLPADQPYASSGNIRTVDCSLTSGASIPQTIPENCFTKTAKKWDGRTVYLIGDSHAFSNFAMIAGLEKESQLRGAALVHDGCAVHKVHPRDSSCARYQRSIVSLLDQHLQAGDVILVAAFFPLNREFDQEQYRAFMTPIAEFARERQAEVAIELPHLLSEKTAIACTKEWFRNNYDGCTKSLATAQEEREATVDVILSTFEPDEFGFRFWDPLPHLCDEQACDTVQGSMPILRDNNHLSVAASASLTPQFVLFLETANGT